MQPGESIQAAVDAAAEGAAICLTAGEWEENLIITKSLTLQGAGAEHSVLRGSFPGPVIVVAASHGSQVCVQGLTITGGETSAEGGPLKTGVYASGEVHLALIGCTVSRNAGGGIMFSVAEGSASLVIEGCTIEDNEMVGAMIVNGGSGTVRATISSSTIAANALNHRGHGIVILNSVDAQVTKSVITKHAGTGVESAGIPWIASDALRSSGQPRVTVEDCTITENGTGIAAGNAQLIVRGCDLLLNDGHGLVLWRSTDATIEENLISGNGRLGIVLGEDCLMDLPVFGGLVFTGRVTGRANTIMGNGGGAVCPSPSLEFLMTAEGGELDRTEPQADFLHLFAPENLGCGRVMFNGVCHSKAEGPLSWEWGDGMTTQGWFPQTHQYLSNGVYTVTVTLGQLMQTALVSIEDVNEPGCAGLHHEEGSEPPPPPTRRSEPAAAGQAEPAEAGATMSLPEGAVARLGLGSITSVAYSPDGRLLAVGTSIGVEVREARSLKLVGLLTSPTASVVDVAYSPDGRILAAASYREIKLWDVMTGREVRTLASHTGWVTSIAFSLDGMTLASGSDDTTIRLWDVETGRELRTLRESDAPIYAVAFSPDGRVLASGSYLGAKIWNVETGEVLHVLKYRIAAPGFAGLVTSLAFSPDGTILATVSGDFRVGLWDVQTGQVLRFLVHAGGYLSSLAFSPDGLTLASAADTGSVKLWNVETWEEQSSQPQWGVARAWSLAFSPDGATLAVAAASRTLRLWDVSEGREILALTGHSAQIHSMAFSTDGTRLATGSADGTVKLWDAATHRQVWTSPSHWIPINAVAFSQDGAALAVGTMDGSLMLWGVETGAELRIPFVNAGLVWSAVFSPDGARLAVGSHWEVCVWNTETGERSCILTYPAADPDFRGIATAAAFSPDQGTLATGSEDGTVCLWSLSTGTRLLALSGHAAPIRSIAFSPEGKLLASGSDDRSIRVWDGATGKGLCNLTGHRGSVYSVAFSPVGAVLASGSLDGTVRLWDAETCAEITTLRGHTSHVYSVAFSQDGRILASGSLDGTVLLWDMEAILKDGWVQRTRTRK